MQLTKLLSTDEEQAVSPVIGVILMVAITVILAAVIASFVLGLGSDQEVAPTATFDFDYEVDDDDASGDNTLTITHTGGDNIVSSNLYIRGSLGSSGDNTGNWESLDGEVEPDAIDGQSAVSSGNSVILDEENVPEDYTARVVWQSATGSSSSELASDSGPDA